MYRSRQTLQVIGNKNGFVLLFQKAFHDKTKKITKHCFLTTRTQHAQKERALMHYNHITSQSLITDVLAATFLTRRLEADIQLAFSNAPSHFNQLTPQCLSKAQKKKITLDCMSNMMNCKSQSSAVLTVTFIETETCPVHTHKAANKRLCLADLYITVTLAIHQHKHKHTPNPLLVLTSGVIRAPVYDSLYP